LVVQTSLDSNAGSPYNAAADQLQRRFDRGGAKLKILLVPFFAMLLSAVPASAAKAAREMGASPAAAAAHQRYDAEEARRLVPLLTEVLRFDTVAEHREAHAAQRAWLSRIGTELGFTVRDTGPVTEIELPAAAGAPVLGLVVHGDVQPVDAQGWTRPPFAGVAADGYVYGRGAADDKGPLVQALLAMHALQAAGPPRTHVVRLLVGSDEESGNADFATYLKTHAAPDYSLVLDSDFPVVVGEKAWNALVVAAPREADDSSADANPRAAPAKAANDSRARAAARFPFMVQSLEAGLAPSIVPDRAHLVLRWRSGKPSWKALLARLRARKPDAGTRLDVREDGALFSLTMHGRAAHGGVNLEGGRNALVSLARIVDGALPPCGLTDLLSFAALAGQDLHGTGLGLIDETPLWGRYAVNVATAGPVPKLFGRPGHEGETALTINLRRPPPLSGPQLKERMDAFVARFDERTSARLVAGGFYDDEPFGVPPDSKLVRRLMDDYFRASGRDDPPAISGGGTYAKRIPNAVAFGMWFPGTPYPGHDTDEKVRIDALHSGAHVLVETLADLASGPRIEGPFKP
jgi:acetylornithine deacetylase/succinyl-diaminopimelate desuccinylase-like protein